jgi:hypothetical protein
MKPIKLTEKNWQKIRELLLQEHPKSAIIIRWKMKEVLGFTVRDDGRFVHLDFFDEKKYTFFCLKFSEYINGNN